MKDKIKNELINIAPTLTSLDKNNPFKVPNGYFTSLGERTIDGLVKNTKSTQSLPIGYFEGLSDKVLEKVTQEKESKLIPLYKRNWFAIAASFLVLIGATYMIKSNLNTVEPSTEFALEIEPEEALDYLIENGDLYLTDLISLEIENLVLDEEIDNFEIFEDTELNNFLNELDQADLEDLL